MRIPKSTPFLPDGFAEDAASAGKASSVRGSLHYVHLSVNIKLTPAEKNKISNEKYINTDQDYLNIIKGVCKEMEWCNLV
jgi:hypothetical protein